MSLAQRLREPIRGYWVYAQLVISAGIAEIQQPWMAMPDILNCLFSHIASFSICFSHPCVLDSGDLHGWRECGMGYGILSANPCRNDGHLTFVYMPTKESGNF
jgi:hypothetical protein